MKTPASHPWKRNRKVKAECLACGKTFERDPEGGDNTCSFECRKAYAKMRRLLHITKGGFR